MHKILNKPNVVFFITIIALYHAPLFAVDVNKYDWNKTVKWKTNTYGEPVDVCYNYRKSSIDYRQCSKKAKQIFAQRCKYGKKSYCKNQMRRSHSRAGMKKNSTVRKAGRNSASLK